VDITKVRERVATALGEPTITAGGTTDEWMSLTRSVLTTLCAGVDLIRLPHGALCYFLL
jgi:hypothetical protein